MESAVIDLPLPDSPTMPRLLPRSSVKLTPLTALLMPRRLVRCVLRSVTSSRATQGLPVMLSAAEAQGLRRACLDTCESSVRRFEASSKADCRVIKWDTGGQTRRAHNRDRDASAVWR